MESSFINKRIIRPGEALKAQDIRAGVFNLIKKDYPEFTVNHYISMDELNQYRRLYLTSLITMEKGELAVIDKDVVNAIRNNSILSENIRDEIEKEGTLAQKLADKVAAFGGSWTFIISFFTLILIWMMINVLILASKPFDPFPFILLNLILSCLAAI